MNRNKILAIIPARGGSKGLPGKNIKEFAGKPLIYWTIDAARAALCDDCICVSTDDDNVINAVELYGLKVPFKRPSFLATDTSSTNDVIVHAINYYKKRNLNFDWVLLLQPTSPLRTGKHLEEILKMCENDIDMIVSVKESHAAAVLCQEDEKGYLELYFNKRGSGRQSISRYYEYNGAAYLVNIESLLEKGIHGMQRVKKYVMDAVDSIDIDDLKDFELAEFYKLKYKL